MKTITVKTRKVVSHDSKKQAIYEEINQVLQPELTWMKFLKYLSVQEYISAEVIEVDGKTTGLEEYQKMIDEKINEKPETNIDYKAKAEKQEKQIADLLQRLENLEKAKNEMIKQPVEKQKPKGRPKQNAG